MVPTQERAINLPQPSVEPFVSHTSLPVAPLQALVSATNSDNDDDDNYNDDDDDDDDDDDGDDNDHDNDHDNTNNRLCGLIVRVRVVPRRTVVGDINRRFDNLSGSHHQSHVNCVWSVYGIYVSGQLSRDVIAVLNRTVG